jgi:hypothetical protein
VSCSFPKYLRKSRGPEARMRPRGKSMLSAAVTLAEHQAFTNAWRAATPYGPAGTGAATRETVLQAAREIGVRIDSGHNLVIQTRVLNSPTGKPESCSTSTENWFPFTKRFKPTSSTSPISGQGRRGGAHCGGENHSGGGGARACRAGKQTCDCALVGSSHLPGESPSGRGSTSAWSRSWRRSRPAPPRTRPELKCAHVRGLLVAPTERANQGRRDALAASPRLR